MKDVFDQWLQDNTDQRSKQWHDVRLGRFTSSEIWKLMVMPRQKTNEWSEKALGYIHQKVAEELTGEPTPQVYAYPLVYGEETEPIAKEFFSKYTGMEVKQSGFVPYRDFAGGSPDGLIGENMGLEIKCPYNSVNQIDYLLQCKTQNALKTYWPEYYWQCMSLMFFTGRKYWCFVTFDPRMKNESHKITITQLEWDVPDIERLTDQLEKANEYKLSLIKSITNG